MFGGFGVVSRVRESNMLAMGFIFLYSIIHTKP